MLTGWGARAVLVLLVWRVPPLCVSWCPLLRTLPQSHGTWPFLFLALSWFLAPVLRCPRCPVPVGACLLPTASPRPLAAGLPFALSFPGVVVVGWWRGLWGADGSCPGMGGMEPPAEGFGGVGGAEALDRVRTTHRVRLSLSRCSINISTMVNFLKGLVVSPVNSTAMQARHQISSYLS